jgi:carboxypeptidase T
MPPTGYLTVQGIWQATKHLAVAYPHLCELIELPERSASGDRRIHAVRIGNQAATEGPRRGVLLIGGMHAREVINPDLLVSFGLRLCTAYTAGLGLTFGSRSYSSSGIATLLDHLDVFVLPLMNPDGREHVQRRNGDRLWRKNRAAIPGTRCRGVDLNRNFDYLWPWTIGITSDEPCNLTFKGTAAASEPETRNVVWLLDTFPQIRCVADVHSLGEEVLYPWGDDDNQTSDPHQHFQNPAYDGQRGTLGSGYEAYISPADEQRHIAVGNRVRDAIAEVRGRGYAVKEGSGLYPMSGTCKDWAYSRHLVDPAKRKILSFLIETGWFRPEEEDAWGFQPPYAEALEIMDEVQSGLVQLLIDCLCVAEAASGSAMAAGLERLRAFRDQELLRIAVGRRWVALLEHHTLELVGILGSSKERRHQARALLGRAVDLLPRDGDRGRRVSDALFDEADALFGSIRRTASPSLRRAMEEVRKEVEVFRGRTVREGLAALAEADRSAAQA